MGSSILRKCCLSISPILCLWDVLHQVWKWRGNEVRDSIYVWALIQGSAWRNGGFISQGYYWVALWVRQSQEINRPDMGFQRCVQRIHQSVPQDLGTDDFLLLHSGYCEKKNQSLELQNRIIHCLWRSSHGRLLVDLASWSFEEFGSSWEQGGRFHHKRKGSLHLPNSRNHGLLQRYSTWQSKCILEEWRCHDCDAVRKLENNRVGVEGLNSF